MKNNTPIADIMAIITECESTVMATYDNEYPDIRDMTNVMNRDATSPTLYFMTARNTPKYSQLANNPSCVLYYFDNKTRHAVRLYGKIEFISDMTVRTQYWRPDFAKFGYDGPSSPDFILMRFSATKYKYYIGNQQFVGDL